MLAIWSKARRVDNIRSHLPRAHEGGGRSPWHLVNFGEAFKLEVSPMLERSCLSSLLYVLGQTHRQFWHLAWNKLDNLVSCLFGSQLLEPPLARFAIVPFTSRSYGKAGHSEEKRAYDPSMANDFFLSSSHR